ncbi:PREDICTED: heat shock transcription factor, Y-linked-like [Bison bison bison]|uniref:Heat shock transcription factor, Y-linked-like n=1 Tax=Bison bison bison TaxID=43346 RepID=A0A6P3GFG1_BISBB|nr:PREDICTED: heat shock transcription factor, Y-linked-like [Bison bison bison]
MAHIPSEIQDGPPKDESTGSETSIRSSLYEYTLTRDSVLKSMIEDVPFIQEPHTSQIVTNTNALSPCDLPNPSPILVRQTDQIVVDQPAVLKKLSIFNWYSHSSHTQVNGHIEHFATTATSTSQNHFVSPLQSSYSRLMVEPSKFPVRHSDMSGHDSPFPNLQERGNSWFSVPTTASSLSSQLINNHYMKTMLIKTDLSNTCQIMEPKED